MKVKTFTDFFSNGHSECEIACLYSGKVVRKMRVEAGKVHIDACDGETRIAVPLTTPITFQPWVFDRGNLLFSCPEVPQAKICGEGDVVRYPDGTEDRAQAA